MESVYLGPYPSSPYGTQIAAREMREKIVKYSVTNWADFSVYR